MKEQDPVNQTVIQCKEHHECLTVCDGPEAECVPTELTDLFHLGQLSTRVLIVPQVFLVPHQNNGHVRTEVFDLRSPLLWNILCVGFEVDMLNTGHTDTGGLSKTAVKKKAHLNCRGCRWRNTWGWHLCLGRREVSVDHNPLDQLCPKEPAPPVREEDVTADIRPCITVSVTTKCDGV